MTPRRSRHPVLGAVDFASGVLALIAIWAALPARWWPVDVIGTMLGIGWLVSGGGLLLGTGWSRRFAYWLGVVVLILGAALTVALAMTIGFLSGTYGPVGEGGALILSFVVALFIPYLLIFPAAKLLRLSSPRLR